MTVERTTAKRLAIACAAVYAVLNSAVALAGHRAGAMGPLAVHPDNPRYFQNTATGELVYLTGSHTWANFQERGVAGETPDFDFAVYLDLLHRHHHNFIRLWTWEHAQWMQFASRDVAIRYTPLRYARTGPGRALDGGPKFDVTRYNQVYFDRLRHRVSLARDRGFYVSVMLFQGFSIEQKGTEGVDRKKGNPWDGHPLNRRNNINGIDGDSNGNGEGEEVHTLKIPAVTRLQEAYVRKIIDTLNDCDNVLWEISNESHGDSTAWQYHFIRLIHQYEKTKPRQHPVGMTFQWGRKTRGSNENLFRSPADWISPNPEGGYRDDPPAADGRKVILTDTDHLWGIGGNRTWVWKSFARGLNPIFMDLYKDVRFDVLKERDQGWAGIRRAMGHTLTYAEKMDLAKATPRPGISSTGYCLANPAREYLVYQPQVGESFTLDLAAGKYRCEWFDPESGKVVKTDKVSGANGKHVFTPPFKNDAVLYLRSVPR